MIRKFLKDNRVLLTNLVLILLIVVSYFVKDPRYAKFAHCVKVVASFGLACSIINWFALEILLDKFSFLYSTHKIRGDIKPFKKFLVEDIFSKKNYDIMKDQCEYVLTDADRVKIEGHVESGLSNVLDDFKVDSIKEDIVKNLIARVGDIETTIKFKLNGDSLCKEDKEKVGDKFFREEILPIIDNKIELVMISDIQKAIYGSIKDYFEWLVIWGAFGGVIFGIFFKVIRCI